MTTDLTRGGRVRAPVLGCRDLSVGYGTMAVLTDIDLEVNSGEVVALLGSNGVGKTTLLLTLAGAIPALGGDVRLDGRFLPSAFHRRARMGIASVLEHSVFGRLTTIDNLRVGRGDLELAFELFPELRARAKVLAGTLSGGEQRMLALARALASHPRVLLADELSLGLAPLVVRRLLTAVRDASRLGLAVLLVEQRVADALDVADHAYVLDKGRLATSGSGPELLQRMGEIEGLYLGRPTEAR